MANIFDLPSSFETSIDVSIDACPSSTSPESTNAFPIKGKRKGNKRRRRQKEFYDIIREEVNVFDFFHDEEYQTANRKNAFESDLIPRNQVQQDYFDILRNDAVPIVFAVGSAGTGKTLISCHYAISQLLDEKYDKVIITRPAVSVDEELGFLPGDVQKKMKPWLQPLYDNFQKYVDHAELKQLMKDEVIEICPLAFMRGRTFDNAVIIADEMQNSTSNQMKMLLTRIGENSKLLVNGDMSQSDNPTRNGLHDFISRYRNYKNNKNMHQKDKKDDEIKVIEFADADIQRNPVIETVLTFYNHD